MTEISSNKLIAFGASVTGSQHKHDRRPNEDAWMGGQSKFGTFIAISDGLGSKPNARQGAKILLFTASLKGKREEPFR